MQKIALAHLRSLIRQKYLEITAFVLVITVFVLLTTQFLNSSESITIISASYEAPSNLSSQKLHRELPADIAVTETTIEFKKDDETPDEEPLKTKLKTILKCRDVRLHMEKMQYGEYWLMKNYIRGRKSIDMGCGESITYTTNGDYTFIDNLGTVVERWLAPVSFAIYAPGDDYNVAMDSISYVLNCLPSSELIRDYVSFHIFFPRDHLPSFIAKDEVEALQWPYDCELPPPYANVSRAEMYKTMQNLTYPINVARNIARKAVNTYFIFACDIELYPSLGLVNQFLDMVYKDPPAVLEGNASKVFVLPVFEVHKKAKLPDNKTELQKMLKKSTAVVFHKYVCAYCHLVPQQKEWVSANSTELELFAMGKRYGKFRYWEPFYISDNREPIFDERVTWEGQSNKRVQNYAMCLMDYEYHVLHPAFLVHAPGIKYLNMKSNETITRFNYAAAMSKIITSQIKPEYQVLYGKNKRCSV